MTPAQGRYHEAKRAWTDATRGMTWQEALAHPLWQRVLVANREMRAEMPR